MLRVKLFGESVKFQHFKFYTAKMLHTYVKRSCISMEQIRFPPFLLNTVQYFSGLRSLCVRCWQVEGGGGGGGGDGHIAGSGRETDAGP